MNLRDEGIVEEIGKFKLINPEPVFAMWIRKQKPLALSDEMREWAVDWIGDVGIELRSRPMLVSMVANAVYVALASGILRLAPAQARERIKSLPFLRDFLAGMGVG